MYVSRNTGVKIKCAEKNALQHVGHVGGWSLAIFACIAVIKLQRKSVNSMMVVTSTSEIIKHQWCEPSALCVAITNILIQIKRYFGEMRV